MTREEFDALPAGAYVRMLYPGDRIPREERDRFGMNCRLLVKGIWHDESDGTTKHLLLYLGYARAPELDDVLANAPERLLLAEGHLATRESDVIASLADERNTLLNKTARLEAELAEERGKRVAAETRALGIGEARNSVARLLDRAVVLERRSGELSGELAAVAEKLREYD